MDNGSILEQGQDFDNEMENDYTMVLIASWRVIQY